MNHRKMAANSFPFKAKGRYSPLFDGLIRSSHQLPIVWIECLSISWCVVEKLGSYKSRHRLSCKTQPSQNPCPDGTKRTHHWYWSGCGR
jgi:hypothetical protein